MSGAVAHQASRLAARFPWITMPLIVQAPMRILAGPKLATAVSSAGGLGFVGPGAKTSDLGEDLDKARIMAKDSSTDHQSAISASPAPMPIGVGFQLWNDDLSVAKELVQKNRPCIAWLYAPHDHPRDLITWSEALRSASPATEIWIQIGTVGEVETLVQMPNPPDAIVVQGAEAGGHGRVDDGIGLITLFPEVADLVRASGHKIALIAAGGIADGRGVAAALAMGADGVAMGTRFLAATEARISRGYQQEIVRAADGGTFTTRTMLYNQLRGTTGWPKQYSPRTIINRSYQDHQKGVPFDELKAMHDEHSKNGDLGWGPEGRLATYAGASIGLIKDVRDAGVIVRDVRKEADEIFSRLREARL